MRWGGLLSAVLGRNTGHMICCHSCGFQALAAARLESKQNASEPQNPKFSLEFNPFWPKCFWKSTVTACRRLRQCVFRLDASCLFLLFTFGTTLVFEFAFSSTQRDPRFWNSISVLSVSEIRMLISISIEGREAESRFAELRGGEEEGSLGWVARGEVEGR